MNIITDPTALLVARSDLTAHANSALPWAPVVPDTQRQIRPLLWLRSGLAESLLTLSVKVRPLEPGRATRQLSAGR
jgi:hypothetical protein